MFRKSGLLQHVDCPKLDCCLASACFFCHVARTTNVDQDRQSELNRHIRLTVATPTTTEKNQSTSVSSRVKRRKLSSGILDDKPVELKTSQPAEIMASIVKRPVDSRYQGKAKSELPALGYDPLCKIPHEQRLKFHGLFQKEFDRIYQVLEDPPDHATAQELHFSSTCSASTYKAACVTALMSLRKRPQATSIDEIGLYPDWQLLTSKSLTWDKLVHPISVLRDWGYTTEMPCLDDKEPEEGQDRICDRCSQRFIVTSVPSRWQICTYHPSRPVFRKQDRTRVTTWPCCENESACKIAPSHVFKVTHAPRLAFYQPYRMLPSQSIAGLDLVALDCEMVYTVASMELARVSVVSADGKTLLDSFVKPAHPVLDYNTTFSGVQADNMKDAVTFDEMHERLSEIGLNRNTILVGHGLDNDLTAMRLIHHRVIDSAILFPHQRGRPYRFKLKDLSSRYLARNIQMESNVGHDPTEDATAALDLVRWRLKHGDATPKIEPFQGKLK